MGVGSITALERSMAMLFSVVLLACLPCFIGNAKHVFCCQKMSRLTSSLPLPSPRNAYVSTRLMHTTSAKGAYRNVLRSSTAYPALPLLPTISHTKGIPRAKHDRGRADNKPLISSHPATHNTSLKHWICVARAVLPIC